VLKRTQDESKTPGMIQKPEFALRASCITGSVVATRLKHISQQTLNHALPEH